MIRRAYRAFRRAKLRTKLFISFLAVSVVPIVVLGTVACRIARDSLHGQMSSRIDDRADRAAAQIGAVQRRCSEAIDAVVYDDELLLRLTALQNGRIQIGELRLYESEQLARLRLASASVRRLELLLSGDLGLRYNDRALQMLAEQAQSTDDGGKSSFWFATEDELLAVYAVSDLYAGRQVARVVVTFDKQGFFDEAFLGDSNDHGVVVADAAHGVVIAMVRDVMTTGMMPLSFLEHAPSELVTYNGATYLFSARALPALSWTVYVIGSYAAVQQSIRRIVILTVTAATVGALLIGVLAYLLSANFASRIEFLIRQMKKVSKGNWLIEPADAQDDEIGQLGRAFEQMVSELEVLVYDVYESKLAQRDSEFKSLQAQIDPHFLYNCLDNLNWYAIMRGDEHSSYIITRLSEYYRTCLNRGRNTSTVADELKNAAAYMDLQRELHDNRFVFEQQIEPGLDDLVTINLMLQPLLENAVKHGVDRAPDRDGTHLIRLCARREGDGLVFTVFNTGQPIDPQAVDSALRKKTRGYGLYNVDERLRLLFGPAYGGTVAPVEDGTLCTVRIPAMHRQPQEREDEPAAPLSAGKEEGR